MRLLRVLPHLPLLLALSLSAAAPALAHADTIAWTTWTSATGGSSTPGSATGTLTSSLYGTVTVSYTGQNSGLLYGYPSWNPAGTYTGGVVGNAPPAADNSVQIEGGQPYTETFTFSTPVADPILAIWSLGSGNTPAYFDFTAGEPFNLVAGGPSAEYGGSAIQPSGESIFGMEGNGVVQFVGTYSSITFTTPDYENFYAFTIGEDDTLTSNPPPPPGTTPEPGTLALLGTGLTLVPLVRRRIRP